MMLEILVHLGWSSSGLKTILFSFRKLQDSNWTQMGWLTTIEEDDEGCPCIFASTPFNNEWHLNVVWSSQLNAKLKHSIMFQQATWEMFVTLISWKTHLGLNLECWFNNELAQSFCVGFSFFNSERVHRSRLHRKSHNHFLENGCRHAGVPEVLDLFNSERLHSE